MGTPSQRIEQEIVGGTTHEVPRHTTRPAAVPLRSWSKALPPCPRPGAARGKALGAKRQAPTERARAEGRRAGVRCHALSVTVRIRDYVAADQDAVVELSLRAWTPVFASMEAVLGAELATHLHGEDWRAYQARSVSETLAAPSNHSWVTEADGRTTGFVVAAIADPDRGIGQIAMLAVDPADQRHGHGRALTDHATAWLRDAGMRVAVIGTGGDPGHAPARRLYEQAGYRLMPAAQYFKVL
jgi:ribosomal protein S18 acetylase RimI-like enzyme